MTDITKTGRTVAATLAIAIGLGTALAPAADATKQRSGPRTQPTAANQSFFCNASQGAYNDAVTQEQQGQLEIDGHASPKGPSSQDYLSVGNMMGCATGQW